jgi:hypothetical protein
MSKYYIDVPKNKGLVDFILAALYKAGYKVNSYESVQELLKDRSDVYGWMTFDIDISCKGFAAYIKSFVEGYDYKLVSIPEFLNYLEIPVKPEFVEVVIKPHVAIVRKDKIVVGCQTFPISIIDELEKLINKQDKVEAFEIDCQNAQSLDVVLTYLLSKGFTYSNYQFKSLKDIVYHFNQYKQWLFVRIYGRQIDASSRKNLTRPLIDFNTLFQSGAKVQLNNEVKATISGPNRNIRVEFGRETIDFDLSVVAQLKAAYEKVK